MSYGEDRKTTWNRYFGSMNLEPPAEAQEVTARREREAKDKLKRHDERWGLDGFGSALPRYVSAGDREGDSDVS